MEGLPEGTQKGPQRAWARAWGVDACTDRHARRPGVDRVAPADGPLLCVSANGHGDATVTHSAVNSRSALGCVLRIFVPLSESSGRGPYDPSCSFRGWSVQGALPRAWAPSSMAPSFNVRARVAAARPESVTRSSGPPSAALGPPLSSPDSDPALCRYPDCRPASAQARSGATAPGLGGLASEPPRRAHSDSESARE